ncbi:MAG: copper chaperone PCu(A)C [Ectothiorhodospiraceae bacterium]|nr:copper chaperone PCu(A)C [Ectothiorhodospiraceae bacterium]
MLRKCLSLVALSACLLPWSAMADTIDVHDAWVREMPAVAQHSAAYMVLENNGEETRELVGGSSPQFGRVEIHESVEEDGVARMVKQESLRIPAGEKVVLEPGGYHVMLMRREVDALRDGDYVDLELEFDNGARKMLRVPVRKAEAGHGGHHGGHHSH